MEIYIVSLEVSSFDFDRFTACFYVVFSSFFIFVGQCEDGIFCTAMNHLFFYRKHTIFSVRHDRMCVCV